MLWKIFRFVRFGVVPNWYRKRHHQIVRRLAGEHDRLVRLTDRLSLDLARLAQESQCGAAVSLPAEKRVERNVVYGMYSGLALLMDVHHPAKPNGYGLFDMSGNVREWTRGIRAPCPI